ncbi:nuclear transcription factor Y subunit B-1-like [Bidens hawaiensis]|uniref:nuclear transcription factor Y subunit B-1-like n=1 Tax=Bidens hawaiensis TaxID=980011 RepID=UPI00404ADABD
MADVPGSPGGNESGGEQNSNIREQDRFLPIANISRIMKKALPANGKIAKDAKETAQECVSEFISFVTSEASDKCQKEKRKTINGDDLLWAMATLGFEDYIEPLKVYLSRYREVIQFVVNPNTIFFWELFLLSFLHLFSNTFTVFFLYDVGCLCGMLTAQFEGDTKGSGKKDTVGSQIVPNAEYTHQGSYTQGMNYF